MPGSRRRPHPRTALFRRLLLVGIAVVLLGSLAACGGGTHPAPSRALRYFAMGDSYTSAPLVPTTDLSTGCLRSDHNYPHLLAAALGNVTLTDHSCGSAQTLNVLQPQSLSNGRTNPPQIDGLSAGTDLVTIGLGANDYDFVGRYVFACARIAVLGQSSTCSHASGGRAAALLPSIGTSVQARLEAVVRQVRQRAPRARIMLIGYPRVLPRTGTCPGRLPAAAGDYALSRRALRTLDAAVAGAARATGATFVDLWGVSRGHDICSSSPWINGVHTIPGQAAAFHPFEVEQQAVARLVEGRLGHS